MELTPIWVHVTGVPHTVRHFLGLWDVGTLIGKTLDVDLLTLRRRGIIRILVGMRDLTPFGKENDTEGPCILSETFVMMKGYMLRFQLQPHRRRCPLFALSFCQHSNGWHGWGRAGGTRTSV